MVLPTLKQLLEANGKDAIDDESDFISHLSTNLNFATGVYLYISGIAAVILNGAIIATLNRFVTLFKDASRISTYHLCAAILSMTVFGGFLFSGSSSLAGKWLFGYKGCQLYAFTGFWFGIVEVNVITIMSYIRYRKNDKGSKVSDSEVSSLCKFAWLWSLFWAAMPLLGWASYGFEPSRTTCTIEWTKNDASFLSYSTWLVALVYIVPIAIMIWSSCMAVNHTKPLKKGDDAAAKHAIPNEAGAKMCSVLFMVFLCCWSGYTILVIAVILGNPEDVPIMLAILPPILAKLSSVVYPIVILKYDDTLRESVLAWLTSSHPKEIGGDLQSSKQE